MSDNHRNTLSATEILAKPVSTNPADIFDMAPDPLPPILPGDMFGQWTVELTDQNPPPGYRYIFCRCSCGVTKFVRKTNLIRGLTKSCQSCGKGKYARN